MMIRLNMSLDSMNFIIKTLWNRCSFKFTLHKIKITIVSKKNHHESNKFHHIFISTCIELHTVYLQIRSFYIQIFSSLGTELSIGNQI